MSVQIPPTTVPTRLANSDTERRSANFHPSIWGHHFLLYYPDSAETNNKIEHQNLKEEVKRLMLMATGDDEVSQKLQFIDAIQRLGVSYHFEREIDAILRDINSSFQKDFDGSNMDDNLYIISLRFRLLRAQGYKVSCDVFNKFKDSQGNFKDILVDDIRGMLSLYEATHFSVHGEEIMDEALAFTASHLDSITSQLGSPLSAQITHALKQPIRKGSPRLEARRYFTVYQEDALCNKTLLNFAKLDFNILQKLHQKELSEIAKWWKELDFANKLPFARDRVVECYFWILGVYFEPEYILARKILTKAIAMTSVLDDIYDVYGTPEELELLTAAIERWDEAPGDELPKYMKIYYKALVDVFTEIEEILVNDNRWYRLPYAKEALKRQAKAYLLESKWFHRDEIPTMEEYLSVALMTSAYPLLATISLVGMGDIVTKESFDWICDGPKIVTASSVICRLMDDIVSHKFEQKRGHVASAVQCYMKQHGVTEEEATSEFRKQIVEAWKHINEECLYPTAVPMPLLMRILNLSRVIDVIYKEEDGYTHAGSVLKNLVSSLLVDPAPL